MPEQQQRQTPNRRRVAVDGLWKHLEKNVRYKKFYYEAFRTMQVTSDARLEVISEPFYHLCAIILQKQDIEQLICDIVMYRCDNSNITTTAPLSRKNSGGRSISTCGKDDHVDEHDVPVQSNRHRPWYQGYSTGFVDVCSLLLQMMMMMNANNENNKNIILNSQRGTILALHRNFHKLQQCLQAVLEYTTDNTTITVSASSNDGQGDPPSKNANSSNHEKIAVLLQPLEPFLTPRAYREMRLTLVTYDATKHKDVVLLGYCHGAIAACTYILRWTQLVVVQNNHKKKKNLSKNTNFTPTNATAPDGDGSDPLFNLSVLASKMEVIATNTADDDDVKSAPTTENNKAPTTTTTTDDIKTTSPPSTTTSVGSISPSSNYNRKPYSVEPTQVLHRTPRTPYNTPRRVSFGMEEKNKPASSDATIAVPALLQFTTGHTVDILSHLNLPKEAPIRTSPTTGQEKACHPAPKTSEKKPLIGKTKAPSVLYSKMVFPTRATTIVTTTETTNPPPQVEGSRRSNRIMDKTNKPRRSNTVLPTPAQYSASHQDA